MSDETRIPSPVDDEHSRPDGLDDTTIEALGKLGNALEAIERARGHLYSWHQLTGSADFDLDDAVESLRKAGHAEWADRIERELIGRNVLDGRWTFQVMEEYDDGYYATFKHLESRCRGDLADGRRHLYEAGLKLRRRTEGQHGHAVEP